MGERYNINSFLRIAFILFFLLISNKDYVYAESMEEANIKEVIVNALYGLGNNNVDEFMADFLKISFKGKVALGTKKGKILDYEEFRNNFISELARSSILSVDNISFLDIKASGNNANVSVEYSLSFNPFDTSGIIRIQRSINVDLKKEGDDWKIIGWDLPVSFNTAPLR